jgi:hypothetical protein
MLGWPLIGSLGGSRGDTVTGKIGALILALRSTLSQT